MQRHAIIACLIMLIAPWAVASGPPTSRSDLDDQIAAEIKNLGSASKDEAAAAATALVKIGKPAAPALVGTLADDRDDVQANAAVALRQILAADASAIPNKHDMAYWKEKTAGLKPGMPETDAVKLLMQTLSPAARETAGLGGGGTNWSYVERYQVDDYWVVQLHVEAGASPKLSAPPDLISLIRRTSMKLPFDFTGTRTEYYANGQKYTEIQYRGGKYDGTFTMFYEDGSKQFLAHYKMNRQDGLHTTWYRNGQKSYEAQYKDGVEIGTIAHWSEDGQLEPQ